ncbi:hypothetical protein PV-S19_0020 [Pacmanvirus S19]|nr:hypothetical protein PV-S19_0020 [Pacmanvirus S19]
MATETVYTTGKSSSNARINIGSGALSTTDGQIAFPDECTSIKLVGAGSHPDGQGTLLIIDSNGIIKRAGGAKTTIATVVSDPATPTTYGTVYGQTTTDGNVIIGSNAAPGLVDDATSSDNTAIGRESLFSVTAGTNGNTAVGTFALYDLTTGTGNTSVGRNSAAGLTTGSNNTFIGQGSTSSVAGCVQSIALGTNSNITADYQLAISDAITHIKCTNLDTAADDTGTILAIDSNGMIKRLGGTKNTGATITAAATPTTLGMVYGYDPAQTAGNVMYGYNAGPTMNSTTQRCTGMGSGALRVGGQTTTWSDSAFGYNSLGNYTSGNWNSAFGSSAGATLTSGNGNVFVGTGADTNAASSTNRIAIGYLAVAKANGEFAIAPSITQIRAEGLSDIAPAGYSKMMYDATNKIMRPMSGCDLWIARLESEYSQSLTSGTGTANIRNLTAIYGSTSSWLTGTGSTITIPSGFPTLGIWEITARAYITDSASLNALSLDVLRSGSTVIARYATGVQSGEWLSYGGSSVIQLSPAQTIQMRLNWVTSGATSVTVKSDTSTYIYLKFLGTQTL